MLLPFLRQILVGSGTSTTSRYLRKLFNFGIICMGDQGQTYNFQAYSTVLYSHLLFRKVGIVRKEKRMGSYEQVEKMHFAVVARNVTSSRMIASPRGPDKPMEHTADPLDREWDFPWFRREHKS